MSENINFEEQIQKCETETLGLNGRIKAPSNTQNVFGLKADGEQVFLGIELSGNPHNIDWEAKLQKISIEG